MDILSFLQQVLGPYTRQKDEALFQCPFCHHSKKKLSVNLDSYKWKCWVCNSKGGHVIWLLKKLNVSKAQLQEARELFDDPHIKRYKETTAEVELFLPKEYKPLWVNQKTYPYLHALSYLKERGIRTEDILRYRIGYCEDGMYKNRVIIPSFDANNKLNYFIARSFYEDSYKYKNPPVSKNVVVFENLINWNEPVILVEGMFDAISLRRNAIPLLGKRLSTNVEYSLVSNGVKEVLIFLDEDARNEAIDIQHKISQYGIDAKIVLTEELDAADLGFEDSWKMIEEAVDIDFKNYIHHKLAEL